MTHIHHQHTTAVPLYHWRGARPWLLDLTPDDTGWLQCLCLHREGEIALMPLSWEQNNQSIPTSFHADALDNEATKITLHELQGDGWQVNGRLTLHFTGTETIPNFWQTIHTQIWQKS